MSMPKAGVEPARGEAPPDFESGASASFATSAGGTNATDFVRVASQRRGSHNAPFEGREGRREGWPTGRTLVGTS